MTGDRQPKDGPVEARQGPKGAPSSGRRGVLNRSFWGLVSQGANTLGNLLASVFVASQCAPAEFGAWGVGYAFALAVLPISRSVGSTSMILTSDRHQPGAESGAVAAGFWVGVAAGCCLVVASLFVGGLVGTSLLAFGIAMPAFLFEDSLRYVFISRRTTRRTAIMDLTWLAVQLIGFGVLYIGDWVTGPTVTVVWAGSAALACLVAKGGGAGSVSPRVAAKYVRERQWATLRLLPDAILNGVSSNALPVVLAIVSGLSSTAALRAGRTLFGPISIVVAGLSPVITAEAVRSLRSGSSPMRLLGLWSAFLAVVGSAFGVLVFVIPDSVGELLFGKSWDLAAVVLLPLAIQAAIRGPFTAGPLMLRARHLLNHALGLRVATALIILIIPTVGAVWNGAAGAAWGIAVAACINGLVAISVVYWTRNTEPQDILERGNRPVRRDETDGPADSST